MNNETGRNFMRRNFMRRDGTQDDRSLFFLASWTSKSVENIPGKINFKTSKAIDTQVYKLDNFEAQFMRQVSGYSNQFSKSNPPFS